MAAVLVSASGAADAATPTASDIQSKGTIVEGGVECPRVKLDDGRVFSLDGGSIAKSELVPGLRVQLTGRILTVSTCQQGAALGIQNIQVIEN